MDLKTMLDDKAEEMRLDPRIPRGVLRRARRRRAANAALAGAVTVGLALGAFVGARELLESRTAGPPELRPGGATEEFYPFIYPPTLQELEVTQDQVAQGSMPMWTEPEGAAILFAVNVMGWEMDDVEVEVDAGDDIRAVVTNQAVAEAAGSGRPIATTLYLSPVHAPGVRMYAVLAAQAEGLELEPIGPEDRLGRDGTIGFRGSFGLVPEGAQVILTADGSAPVSVAVPDGRFEVETRVPEEAGWRGIVTIALADASGKTIALTSSQLASPIAGRSESGASEPERALPARVLETREAILAAARTRDFQALRALIPDDGFTFSFGGETDPIAYWQGLEQEGVTVLSTLEGLLSVPPVRDRDMWVWPAPAGKQPSEWTEEDETVFELLVDLGVLTERERRDYLRFGYYYGWRAGIDREGAWRFYVAGD